jgi:hypothetical protein
MEEEHGLATMRTGDWMGLRSRRARRWRDGVPGWRSGREAVAQSDQTSTPGGSEEAIVANFHEVMGQHMLQEAVDEFLGTQGTPFLCTGLGIAIAKCHPVIFQLEEPVVAQGNAENVGSQVLQSIQTAAHSFTMDHPLLLPDLWWDPGITSGVPQCLLQLAAEHSRKGSYG